MATIKEMLRSFQLTARRKKAPQPKKNPQLEEAHLQPEEKPLQAEEVSPQSVTTSQSEPSGARLLLLPGELRTMIFEYVVVSPGVIEVTKDLRPPALVQVNRQIRAETYKLWRMNNRFKCTVRACDTRLLCKFRLLQQQILSPMIIRLRIDMINIDYVCHWANLVEWCKYDYQSETKTTYDPLVSGMWPYTRLVSAALQLAGGAKSWGEVERGLKALRPVAGELDAQWLEDREVGK